MRVLRYVIRLKMVTAYKGTHITKTARGLATHCHQPSLGGQAHLVTVSSDAHQEVVGLDVSVNEVLVVHVLDPADHLRDKGTNGRRSKRKVINKKRNIEMQ